LEEEEDEITIDNNEIFNSRAFAIQTDEGKYVHSIHILENITQQKQAEQSLFEMRELAQDYLDVATVILVSLNTKAEITVINDTGCKILGYEKHELIGKNWFECCLPESEKNKVTTYFEGLIKGEAELSTYQENYIITHSGERRLMAWNNFVHRNSEDKVISIISSGSDITERAQEMQALEKSEKNYRSLFEDAIDMIHTVDLNGNIIDANQAELSTMGYAREAYIGKPISEIVHPDYKQQSHQTLEKVLKGENIKAHETVLLTSNGELLYVQVSAVPQYEENKLVGARAIMHDITKRKRMDLALQHENRARKIISTSNSMLIHAVKEETLLNNICQLITSYTEFSLAWVGFKQEDKTQSISIVAAKGIVSREYLQSLGLSWADNDKGKCLPSLAIRTGQHQLISDTDEHKKQCSICRKLDKKYNFHSTLALPLLTNKTCIGVLTINGTVAGAFTEQEIELLEELAGDLAYGIVNLRIGKARDSAEQGQSTLLSQLKQTLNKTVQAMASAIEARDPYTAGHQRHVAALSVAIAEELGLSKDNIEGVRIAATIHDLGKIKVPSEILSKPGKITNIEFELIKVHSEVGYDILKDIDFPWPVAEMVRQHHERLDGSGYPRGLKGNDIILGARIIAVADVTEAIASHRPYRASLGIDFALEKMEKGRGKHFDPDVVDACLRLFREKNYQFDLS